MSRKRKKSVCNSLALKLPEVWTPDSITNQIHGTVFTGFGGELFMCTCTELSMIIRTTCDICFTCEFLLQYPVLEQTAADTR